MTTTRGKYTQSEWYLRAETLTTVFIVDANAGAKSVTNDAENVVRACLELYGNRRIVYRDSLGTWDELVHDGKKFTNFAPYDGRLPKR